MGQTAVGVTVILAVGLVLLVWAMLADRRSARRRREELEQAPDRGAALADQPTPAYVIVDPHEQVARSPLSEAERAELEAELGHSQVHDLPAHLADPRLASHSGPDRALVRGPLVVVSHDPLNATEVIDMLEKVLAQHSALVLAAPAFDPGLLDMLAVNKNRGVLVVVPLLADPATLDLIATLTGAQPITRADLQAGYTPHSIFGRAALVLAGSDSATIVPA